MSNVLKDLHLSVRVINKDDINFGFGTVIGSGGGGIVCKATWSHTIVAVKTIRFAFKEKYLKIELLTMSKIRHPNFVSIMAVAIDYSVCHIVMEYFRDSITMRTLLFDEKAIDSFNLNHEKKVDIAIQITTAICYLYHKDLFIIHEDIKPENILINGYMQIKLCDMGLSRSNSMPKDLMTTVGKYDRGTPMYTAPELTSLSKPASTSSDVWAVGCVLVELYSGRMVWESGYSDDLLLVYKEKKVPKAIDIIDCPMLKKILHKCFDYDANCRPPITELHNYFAKAQQKQENKKKREHLL